MTSKISLQLTSQLLTNNSSLCVDYNEFVTLHADLVSGKIDRFLFPDYQDLIYTMDNVHPQVKDTYKIAKVFQSPFQVGMVLSIIPEALSFHDNIFLRCIRTRITAQERWVRQFL